MHWQPKEVAAHIVSAVLARYVPPYDKLSNRGETSRILKPLYPIYHQHKEILLYLFFGGLTFIVSIGSYAFFEISIKLEPLIANIFSWILAVLFAYITNRIWVFENTARNFADICKEISSFFGGRIVTLVIEEIILYVGIEILSVNSIVVKVIGQIIVIVSNYFISKVLVFRSR